MSQFQQKGEHPLSTPPREVWLRGPLPDIPSHVQGVAHALLQAREEVRALTADFPDDLLWGKPFGVASVGFHLQHLQGVLNRLFTYARGEALSEVQLQALSKEGQSILGTRALYAAFSQEVDRALMQLRGANEDELLEVRGVGRQQLPSTVLGLYTHAAEHTMRHVGQLLVTVRVLQAER